MDALATRTRVTHDMILGSNKRMTGHGAAGKAQVVG